MVLSNAGQTVFFTSADRMGLSADAREMLADEGLDTAEDLKVGTKEVWDNFFVTMAKPKLQEVQNNAGTYHQVPRPHIIAASHKKLRKASVAIMFYDQVGRPLLSYLRRQKVGKINEEVKYCNTENYKLFTE